MNAQDLLHRPQVGDAFGMLLQECWNPTGPPHALDETAERDDGRTVVSDARVYFAPYSDWTAPEQMIVHLARGDVLDVGCGGGRLAVEMQQRGNRVYGIDLSPGAVRLCTSRGIDAVVASVPDLPLLHKPFDTIVMAGNGLGLLQDRETAPAILTALARTAREGASLLGTTIDHTAFVDDHDVRYRERNRQRGRLPGQWRIRISHRTVVTDWFDYLFLSPEELEHLVAPTPWSLSDVHLDGAHYLAHLRLK
ncbi:class I SAM-dependent methyltransferase [Streptomyces sp. ISL-22]|nr:class I SAM-dependent methyltransferase [Streptomyces sp. ISL-24]MBT2433537.1 class I SAM-dependent methyltransferase [Streptomyces sp. ISL-22]